MAAFCARILALDVELAVDESLPLAALLAVQETVEDLSVTFGITAGLLESGTRLGALVAGLVALRMHAAAAREMDGRSALDLAHDRHVVLGAAVRSALTRSAEAIRMEEGEEERQDLIDALEFLHDTTEDESMRASIPRRHYHDGTDEPVGSEGWRGWLQRMAAGVMLWASAHVPIGDRVRRIDQHLLDLNPLCGAPLTYSGYDPTLTLQDALARLARPLSSFVVGKERNLLRTANLIFGTVCPECGQKGLARVSTRTLRCCARSQDADISDSRRREKPSFIFARLSIRRGGCCLTTCKPFRSAPLLI